jgi:RES domain-containing protein
MAAGKASGITVWRIAKHTPEFSAADLSGGGAKKTGGRWNSKGRSVLYASASIALATLQTLAHLGDSIAVRNAFLVRIDTALAVWERRNRLAPADLDPTWLAEPAGSATIALGDRWLDSAVAAVLEVPSVIVPEESNLLINPAHADVRLIRAAVARQFIYDPRL